MTLRLPRSRIGRLDLLGFVGPDVVLGENLLDGLQAVLNDRLIVRGAVRAEQVLQHVDRNVRPFLDQLGQVFAHDLAGEVLVEQGRRGWSQAGFVSEVIVKALSMITSTLCCSMPVSASRKTRRYGVFLSYCRSCSTSETHFFRSSILPEALSKVMRLDIRDRLLALVNRHLQA